MKKWGKWFLILTGVLAVFGVGLELYLRNLAEDQILAYLNNRENRQYDYHFEKLRISLLNQRIQIVDFTVKPINKRIEKVKKQESFKTMMWLEIEKVNLNSIDFVEILTNNELKVEDLLVIRPDINVLFGNEERDPDSTTYDGTAIHQLIYQQNVRNINVAGANLNFYNSRNLESPFLKIDSLNLEYKRESNTKKEAEIRLHTANLYNEFEGGFYYKASELEYDNGTDHLKVVGFEVRPQSDPLTYTAQYDQQESWLSFNFDSLSISDVNLDSLILQPDRMHFSKLDLRNADFSLFIDRTKEPKPEEEEFLLGTLIRRIPFELTIDTTRLQNGSIEYASRFNVSDSNAILFFREIDAQIVNFTNSTHFLRNNQTCITNARGKFNGESQINAELKLALTDKRDRFKLNASLDTMELSDLNVYSDLALNTHIKSGKLFKCELKVKGDREMITGSLVTDYKDLHIQFLKEHDQMIKVNPFKAEKDRGRYLIMNTLINGMINKNNKPKGLFYKKSGLVFYEKVPDDNFIDLLIGGILSGINSNAISDQLAKQDQKKYEKRKKKEYREKRRGEKEPLFDQLNPFSHKK